MPGSTSRSPYLTNTDAYAAASLRIVERDGSTIWAEIRTAEGLVQIVTDVAVVDRRLLLDGVHVDGEGLSRTLIHKLAKVLAEGEDVVEVVIQGGIRTTGARPGSVPTAIRVEVKR